MNPLNRALARSAKLERDVFIPLRVSISGKKMRVRVSNAFLGEKLPQTVGVVVTGTRFSGSFKVVDRLRGELAPEGMVMEVRQHPSECRLDDFDGMQCYFSGCAPCGEHPQVIDVLAPSGTQEVQLADYHGQDNGWAQLPNLNGLE